MIRRFSGEEGLQYALQDFRPKSRTAVLNTNLDHSFLFVRARGHNPYQTFSTFAFGADARYGIDCVLDEVAHDLLQLQLIGVGGQIGSDVDFETYTCP